MMSASRLSKRDARRKRSRVVTTFPECCDRCRDRRNTLFDLPEGLLCLTCAFRRYDETNRYHVKLLIKTAVSGRINIERRRRAIAKRNGDRPRRAT